MSSRIRGSLVESAIVLAFLGILAGAIGGFAVGVASAPKTSASSH
jgi:hypothetical protein